ncbi:hypothetical protein BC835DRAFT_1307880 [Cytidiella melzeri]|nr:hypothetical protein BC835DRAFT_1307880 [Cytidiella melzeri]
MTDTTRLRLPEFNVYNKLCFIDYTTAKLIPDTLAELRARHKPPFSNLPSEQPQTETLRKTLVAHLASLTYNAISSTSTLSSGITRHVRHTGSYQASTSGTREGQKRTIQAVSSSRAQAFGTLQSIHPNMHDANITSFYPLRPGNFVLVWQSADLASRKTELMLGRVVTLYTKNNSRASKHAWTHSVDSIGMPLYVAVQTYTVFTGSTYSSNSCKSLDCPTFLNVPRTHVVFSLASFERTILTHTISLGAQEIDTVTLCTESTQLLLTLTLRQDDLSKSIKRLCELCKRSTTADYMPNLPAAPAFNLDQPQVWAAAINDGILAQEDHSDDEEDEVTGDSN